MDESDEDMDNDEDEPQLQKDEEEEPAIVESDVELDESDVVEPDNEPPQKVSKTQLFKILFVFSL